MSTDRRLEIKGISKRYGETVALQNLSFDVRAGELFGFVGRNGAGKTTAMRIVLGVLSADADGGRRRNAMAGGPRNGNDGRQHYWSYLARRARLRQCGLEPRDAGAFLGCPSRVRPVLIQHK